MRSMMFAVTALALVTACGEVLPGPDGGTGGGSGGGGGTASGYRCTTGAVFAGNPTFPDPMMRPVEGAGLREGAPYNFRTVVFSQGQLISHSGQDLWRAALSDGKLHKLVGSESVGQGLVTGPCNVARFSNIFGMALASDGSLFISDQTANAILKITDPLGANCTVLHWAGTPIDYAAGAINPSMVPNVGNVDGPGATAKFALPERIAVDANDNVYVWDNGNDSFRKIANDTAHTVSTHFARVGGLAVVTPTFMSGKLYWYGSTGTNVFLWETDPATANVKRVVFEGRASLFPDGASSDSLFIGGLTNNGTELIVSLNGQLAKVTPAGVVTVLAGVYRPGLDFPSGYDPLVPHAAADLVVPQIGQVGTAGAQNWLAIDDAKNLFLSSHDTSSYVLKVSCAP